MPIQWNRGEPLLEGAPIRAAQRRANITGLANMVQGAVGLGAKGLHNYRAGGLMGIFDPEGQQERQKTEEAYAELEGRLGTQAAQTAEDAQPDAEPDDQWGELDDAPDADRGWLGALADTGGAAWDAVSAGPGGGHRQSLVELARLKGRLGAREDELSRARALSSTVAGSTDPGAVLGRLAPSLGFGKGDIGMRPNRGAGGDPNSDWKMAWHKAREAKGGEEPTADEAENAYYRIRENERAINAPAEKPLRPQAWDKKRELAERAMGGDEQSKALYQFLYPQPESTGDMLRALEEDRRRREGGAPADPTAPVRPRKPVSIWGE
jgi:hypothetical protein